MENLSELVKRFLDKNPELDLWVKHLKNENLTSSDIIKEIWKLSSEDPKLFESFQTSLLEAFEVTKDSTGLERFSDRTSTLETWGFTDEDLIYQPFPDRPGYKMLHPLLMGMIVELLQFDGDVPELRTGPLPEGGSPAVPVITTTQDPVVLGAMLRTASQQVLNQLVQAQQDKDKNLSKMIETTQDLGLNITGLVRQEMETGASVPGYVPGTKAQALCVPEPSISEIIAMPFEEKQSLAHKALTSTQGRRSIIPTIEKIVLQRLNEAFPNVQLGKGVESFIEADYVLYIEGSSKERNPNFNFITTSAHSLSSKLLKHLKGTDTNSHLFLTVVSINEVSERSVGWKAILYK